MFQTFEASTSPAQGAPRLAALRGAIAEAGLDGFLVPRADRFQGEYVAPADDRLAWLTGFTGSAGFAAITANTAAIFVDGRYRVQVRAQTDTTAFTPVDWPATKLADWLKQALPEGGRVGFDPWLHTMKEIRATRAALETTGIALIPTDNLIDTIWENRPPPPAAKIEAYPDSHAGETAEAKRHRLAATLREAGARAAVLTMPDSIAWLLNIRGADIPRNPLAQAFAILTGSGAVKLFCAPGKADDVADHLGPDVAILPEAGFPAGLRELGGTVWVDPATAACAVGDILAEAGATLHEAPDPCALPKARKNATELAGTREAHLRDGAAMVEFLAWLDAQPPGSLTEIDVVKKLEAFRRASNALREISFETIAGSGPNGAIVHYRVTEDTDRRVGAGELLLVDSGGQYLDGTTDITRTIAIGDAPEGAAEAFTRVLQGMIAISAARFPRGVAGRDLDALARAALWRAGMDYDHGTGHGVGVYLCVHEGPVRLSRASEIALEPGMILSNEPGYYREGAFGIRIENLIAVCEAPPGADDRDMLAFETLTWVPIDRRVIEPAMLAPWERDWLNAYHAETWARIGPRVSDGARAWLRQATAAI